ncbi:type III polyketide synthase [Leucobacter coleopterorum]|uniref:Type III polyketide synthase n=1 Tax=Leucobacter coleopterorum TaxID=2714933 RepID=A0ABX6JXY4_9MICO|nr:type III polyketide synthase [Leucobacter coleopterorum]QIM19168.1 type III polyketide synthase [Leucobacter coleopterorum]
MTTHLVSIGTAVPASRLLQSEARDFFAAQPGRDRLAQRLIHAAFDQSAIESRYSVLGGIGGLDTLSPLFSTDGLLHSPTTGERNTVYRREAPQLSSAAARDAIAASGFDATEITHVITASCTGFFAPGPDFLLVKELGIPGTAERTNIGFMGCAAAFPALRAASRICTAQPGSVVLVVCTELCSIHIRSSSDPEQIVASAVFSDGAAAAVVTSAEPRTTGATLEVGEFTTAITSEGEQDMDWAVGDAGFEMRLTAQVPRIIGREIAGAVGAALRGGPEPLSEVANWAVHPGGRSVLDHVQAGLGLSDSAMQHSRAILRDFGNMSSATILFILGRILRDESISAGAQIAALGFGPGLTLETARFVQRAGARSATVPAVLAAEASV